MARMLSDGSCFGVWITWECGACGEQDDIQIQETSQTVIADIDHYCEADDD
jgi:hypothetical protein